MTTPHHAGPAGPPLTVHTLALFASVTAWLAGGWLVLAPFAIEYQPDGGDWADATIVDFVTGLVLLALGAIATGVFAAALVARLRTARPRTSAAGDHDDAASTTDLAHPDDDLITLLKPLVAALGRDNAVDENRLPGTDPAARS